jgi:transposase
MMTEASTKLYAGLDLHANNTFCAVINQHGQPLFQQRLNNELPTICQALQPYQPQLQAVAVESTFNWYWLVDGLQAAQFPVQLANPAKIQQYSGLKRTGDQSDALWLAEMLRLGILPTGYIYPHEQRAVRDMARRRMLVVQQATRTLLSLQSMVTRHTGQTVRGRGLEDWTLVELQAAFPAVASQETGAALLELLQQQRRIAQTLAKNVVARAKLNGAWERLLTLPGVGNILGVTIMLETGPIERFASAGDYASYCRAVDSRCDSNGTKKGENNRKNGNKYLAWAFVEAANYAARYNAKAQAWLARKTARTLRVVAVKALACKLAKAAYYVLRDNVEFSEQKMFG